MNVARARLGLALVALTLALAASGLGQGPRPAAAQGGLFSDSGRQLDASAIVDPTVVRARSVNVNLPLFDSVTRPVANEKSGSSPASVPPPLTLNLFTAASSLFPAVALVAVRDRLERTSSGQGVIWSGRVPGVARSQVTLVVENGIMAGDVRAHGRTYQIRYTGSGTHAIYEIDAGAYLPEREPVRTRDARAAAPGPHAGAPDAAAAFADDGTLVDFMVVYTAAAATEAGSVAAMNTQVDLAVAAMNQAYVNSGVNFRARLVHKGQVNYTEPASIEASLNAITAGNLTNGSGQTVASLRDQFGADVVSLFVRQNADACGVGWLMNPANTSFTSLAFNVVDWTCATGNYSLAHEAGHNMGACHDWFVPDSCNPQVPWGHGFVSPDRSASGYRTIMSYPQSCNFCPRIQYFSSLSATAPQGPVGTPRTAAQPADNAGLFNTNASIVTNFRACTIAPCTGGGGGSAPANDNFAAATAVSNLPANFVLDTTNATTEAGEPLSLSCAGAIVPIGKTIWYAFTPSTSMSATISTAGSGFDTVLAVYTGSALGGLTQVTCNDDINRAGNNFQSQVTFTAAAGVIYRVQIGGFASSAGTQAGSLAVGFSGLSPMATPTANCSPRPNVSVSSAPASGGRLQVTVSTGGGPPNQPRLLSLQFGAATNALIDVGSETGLAGNTTVTLAPETTAMTFFVRRATAGQATTVPFTVVDGCGSWPSLVGGGPSAF